MKEQIFNRNNSDRPELGQMRQQRQNEIKQFLSKMIYDFKKNSKMNMNLYELVNLCMVYKTQTVCKIYSHKTYQQGSLRLCPYSEEELQFHVFSSPGPNHLDEVQHLSVGQPGIKEMHHT